MKQFLMYAVIGFAILSFAGEVTVTGVTAKQRYPWNGLVDITVTMQGSAEDVAAADCIFAATNQATKAAMNVISVKRNGLDSNEGEGWTRKYIWDAMTDVGKVNTDRVELTVGLETRGVQLWEGGPYWAECNVGAMKSEDYGYYFWWGDTVGYKRNASDSGWVSVKDGSSFLFSPGNCPTYGINYSHLQSAGCIDSTGNLVAAHDAATAYWGSPWRMPTDAEFNALISNCITTWTERNGIYGRLVAGKGAYATKSIFLPAAGYGYDSGLNSAGSNGDYWSSTPYSDYFQFAWRLSFGSGNFNRCDNLRYYGQSVRPVRGFAK